MSEPTPGPWTIEIRNGSRHVSVRAGSSNVISIAVVSAGINREANARLIAAAPELLSALEDVMAPARNADLGKIGVAIWVESEKIKTALTIIAKARDNQS